ncbi:hypothetical protein EJ02DRAFT_493737, partial [Clathrospora elynae]
MFWACFNGSSKSPSLFWEKGWGSINKESYCSRIVPLCYGPETYMQLVEGGAPAHSAAYTLSELRAGEVHPIFWPVFSPDLNPIEAVWNKMKDWIELNHPDLPAGRQRSYDQLCDIVKQAWEAITPEYLESLVISMRERCQAVIDAEGGYTKY